MKLLKLITLLSFFMLLGIGAGHFAGPYLRAWSQPAPIEDGNYRDYLSASGKPLVMFSTSTCPYCKEAREYLAREGVPYRDYVIDQSPEAMEVYRRLDETKVPVILTATRKVRGFNSVSLAQALQDAGLKSR